ncbi:hypothetical protein FB451DRAFT_1554626 [Mycena latifolia]|nr:hypothetical protein FB451DRAFT_1554626 [Mycena latifolia]
MGNADGDIERVESVPGVIRSGAFQLFEVAINGLEAAWHVGCASRNGLIGWWRGVVDKQRRASDSSVDFLSDPPGIAEDLVLLWIFHVKEFAGGGDHFLELVIEQFETWAWCHVEASGTRTPTGLYNDGLTTWTYNEGVIGSGLAALAVATGNHTLFQQAEITFHAMIQWLGYMN